VKEVTDESFEADVLRAEGPVVVDFWAPWCGPCKQLTPILEKAVRAAKGKVKLVKMNIDDHPANASRYGVLSIPTVILFENGEPQNAIVGAHPRSFFEQAWAQWLT